MSALPFSSPKEKHTVLNASPYIEEGDTIVTEASPLS